MGENSVSTELRRDPRIEIGDISTTGGRLSFLDHAETAVRGRTIGVSDSGAGAMTVLAAVVTGPLVEWSGLPAAGLAAAVVAAVPLVMLATTTPVRWRSV